MKLTKQAVRFNVINFDKIAEKPQANVKRRHGKLFPNTIRCVISGSSNSGKTNLLLNLLFDKNGLCFENLYVFSKTLNQNKYSLLSRIMDGIPEIGYFTFDENSNVPHPSETVPNSIMVFDDVALEKNNNVCCFFAMGRHNKVDTFYLGQTYSQIPKKYVRDNSNMVVLFKLGFLNLRHVYTDHVNTDMSFPKFQEICKRAWETKNGFLVISKDDPINMGRYRIGFDTFVEV
jgi:hypothetical protein